MRKSAFSQCRKFEAVGLAREGTSGSIMTTMYRLLVFRLLESPRAKVGGNRTAVKMVSWLVSGGRRGGRGGRDGEGEGRRGYRTIQTEFFTVGHFICAISYHQ